MELETNPGGPMTPIKSTLTALNNLNRLKLAQKERYKALRESAKARRRASAYDRKIQEILAELG